MEYYSAMKRTKEVLTAATMWMTRENVKWKKPVMKGHIIYDWMNRKCPE